MNKVLLISPHFDDAVLSAGQFMAERPDTEVMTIFAGMPQNPKEVSTDYDKKCGFQNAEDAVVVRTDENDQATALLDATTVNFGFPDGQYGQYVTEEEITAKIQKWINKREYDFIMAPLGLGHPDHEKVSNAVLALKTTCPLYLWEDLPIRVVEPELVWERLGELEGLGCRFGKHTPATTGDKIAHKIRALLCYKSQIGTGILDPYLLYVPERFYKLR